MKKIFAIPTHYNGTEFKSRFESDVAKWMDDCKIKWEYEPRSFLLKSGRHYMPDFWLPQLEQWIEVKGDVAGAVKKGLYELFYDFTDIPTQVRNSYEYEHENRNGKKVSEIILLGYNVKETRFFNGDLKDSQLLYIGKCSKCSSIFFCGISGIYYCRKCGVHEGDHDIVLSTYDGFLKEYKTTDWIKKVVSA